MTALRTTPERIAELRALAEKATPGPWNALWDNEAGPGWDWIVILFGRENIVGLSLEDAAFIAAARTAVPDLIADITDLTTENERLRAEVAAKDGEIARLKRGLMGAAMFAKPPTQAMIKLQRALDSANARADTAEAALKAGHVVEVTDGWRTSADGMRRERVAPNAAVGHGAHSVQMTIGYTGTPTPPDLAPGLRRAAEIAENMREDWPSDFAHNSACEDIVRAIRAEIGDAS